MVGWIKAPKPMLEEQNLSTSSHDPAIARLIDHDVHLVLLVPDKLRTDNFKPLWKGYPHRRPWVDTALAHLDSEKGPLGVTPWSMRSTALDVDDGNPSDLFGEFPPWADIPSRRRGRHGYYDDDLPRGNSKWESHGCSGDVRGAKGYLLLHGDAAERLADALDRRTYGEHRLPRDLFELAGLSPVLRATKARRREGYIAPQAAVSAPVTINLELTRIGHRNISLFNAVRTWAYVQLKPSTIEAWGDTVLRYGREQNRRFRAPLLPDEVGMLSWNIASWTWNGGGPRDHGTIAQTRRGIASGKVRRFSTYERDGLIVARLDAGERQMAVALTFGVSQYTVSTARARLACGRRAPLVMREIPQEVSQGTLAKLVQDFFGSRGLVH